MSTDVGCSKPLRRFDSAVYRSSPDDCLRAAPARARRGSSCRCLFRCRDDGSESLSRGAASCVFFEGDTETFSYLKQIFRPSPLSPVTSAGVQMYDERPFDQRRRRLSAVFADLLRSPLCHGESAGSGKPLAASLKRLAKPEISTPNCSLILRTPEHTDLEPIGPWSVEDRWELSSMIIWKMKKEETQTEEMP